MNFNPDKLLKLGIGIGAVLIGFAVFYYLVIFLPNKSRQEELNKLREESTKIVEQKQRQEALNACLNEITQRFREAELKNLSSEGVKIAIALFEGQREECFKKYPQE